MKKQHRSGVCEPRVFVHSRNHANSVTTVAAHNRIPSCIRAHIEILVSAMKRTHISNMNMMNFYFLPRAIHNIHIFNERCHSAPFPLTDCSRTLHDKTIPLVENAIPNLCVRFSSAFIHSGAA